MTRPTAIEYYNAIAHDYARADHEHSEQQAEHYLSWLVHFNVPAGKMLDVGIGAAGIALPFKKEGFTVFGVDGAPKMIEEANRAGIPKKNLKCADLEKGRLPYRKESFDVVVTGAALGYLTNGCDVIREMIRVTKPGGVIVMDPQVHDGDFEDTFGIASREGRPPTFIHSGKAIKALIAEFNLEVLGEIPLSDEKVIPHPTHGNLIIEDISYFLRRPAAP
ncbi:MAG TPA: class I SAM-dependent methyltransferase [Alphaproteobacteria bacterium]|nr:class I SAM-dependent methyltransferase [Alphaproteobacteria bacterium]